MTPEDIDKLADEYADKECAMSRHTGKKLKQLHEDKIIEFYDVFGFLIERFCIVEKSEVIEMYAEFKSNIFRSYSTPATMLVKASNIEVAKVNLLEYLFGKDTFEEEGK